MDDRNIDSFKLLESLHEGVVVHDLDTKILYANPRALQILRLTEQQALGKDALDPNWRFVDKHSQLMPSEQFPVNYVIREKKPLANFEVGVCDSSTDEVTWVLCNANPQFNEKGDMIRVVVSFVDVTSRKTRIPFESVVSNANDVIIITEANFEIGGAPKIVYVNNAFTKLTGYDKSEVIGKTPRLLQGPETNEDT